MSEPMRWALLGNLEPPHSTENEWARAIRANGHTLTTFQEGEADQLLDLTMAAADFDVVAWVRTKSLADQVGADAQRRLIDECAAAATPLVGLHLDLWWGLRRQREVATEPFFRVAHLFTADGGHDAAWARAGVTHHWLPPAVSEFECQPGMYRPELASPIGFVGSWAGGYHREWRHRALLVKWLRATYGDRVRFWPEAGQPAVRGDALRDLYASVDVLVGDSCMVGGAGRYWSDRCPESSGRGGFLLHPATPGLDEVHPYIPTWPLGDFDRLRRLIDDWLAHPEERVEMARQSRAHTLEHNTYTVRVGQVLEVLRAAGALGKRAA